MQLQLPTAPPGEVCALDGAFFNRLMGAIQALAQLNVTPPLILSEGPNGRTISVVPTSSDLWFVLTGSATQFATYTANQFNLAIGASFNTGSARNVAQADIGTAGSATVYLVNVREIGKPTHDLDSGGTFLPMLFRGTLIGTYSGSLIYLFDGLQWENCS